MLALLALPLALALQSPAELTLAESLLASNRLTEARRLAEQLERRSPGDPRVLVLLGRVHLEWPTTGRYRAESLFARAAQLSPRSPEAYYWLGRTGLALGGDDGEMIARPALVRMLQLEPDYRDGWDLWARLYRGDRERRVAVEALALHRGNWSADLRRAQMLIELRRHGEAIALLDSVVAIRPLEVSPRAALAQALFEIGRDSSGAAVYEGALRFAHLNRDSSLWRQVRGIASPGERAAYAVTAPEQREAFFRAFWALRDPDLSTRGNERLGEHFRRLAHARARFALLHPNARFHHSRLWRSLAGGLGGLPGPNLAGIVQTARAAPCRGEVTTAAEEALRAVTPGPIADGGELTTFNLEDGLDDRGRVFVRHGPPDQRFVHSTDAETWCYHRPEGSYRVTFIRRTGGWGASGDIVVTPVLAAEVASARRLLTTDRPSLEATLSFSFWPAAFRARGTGQVELLLFPDPAVRVTAVLVGRDGRELARDATSGGPVRLTTPPGVHHLLLDAERDGRQGRYRGSIPLPGYARDSLAISSLLLGPGSAAPTREAMAAAAAPALRLPAPEPMRVYAEIYGLGALASQARYEVRYRFEPLERRLLGLVSPARPTVIAFSREVSHGDAVVESVVLDPGRLPRGRYRLTVEVLDRVRHAGASSASIAFELR